MGKDTEEQVQTVTNTPAAFLQPFLERGAARLEGALDTPRTFFPGQTFADMDPARAKALAMLESIGLGGGAGIEAGNERLLSMIKNGII
ncbi:MAG: hypothetical protein R3330_10335, partial [Saprospiraceae bacterium]|nr:hypothetical protein [Saprospiraceae bacterium]